jgi:hypothetical protein
MLPSGTAARKQSGLLSKNNDQQLKLLIVIFIAVPPLGVEPRSAR